MENNIFRTIKKVISQIIIFKNIYIYSLAGQFQKITAQDYPTMAFHRLITPSYADF